MWRMSHDSDNRSAAIWFFVVEPSLDGRPPPMQLQWRAPFEMTAPRVALRLVPALVSLFASAVVMFASFARADVDLVAGFTRVRLSSARLFSLVALDHRGRAIVDYPYSGNGFVVQFADSVWSGEGHGHEVLEGLTLMSDGVIMPVVDGRQYSGTVLVVNRVVVLDGSLRVRTVMVLTPDGIDMGVSTEAVGQPREILHAYALAESRANRLTSIELAVDGQSLDSATLDRNDSRFYRPILGPVAQSLLHRDPVLGDLVTTSWAGDPTTVWVWDRATDNKIYLVATALDRTDRPFGLQTSIRFCSSSSCAP